MVFKFSEKNKENSKKKGNIEYVSVTDVKFHFFQVEGWYFEISNFNRWSFNSGWLISNLLHVGEADKEAILKYIYSKDG